MVDRYPADVREVILGEKGILKGLRPGGIVRTSSCKNRDAHEVFNSFKIFYAHILAPINTLVINYGARHKPVCCLQFLSTFWCNFVHGQVVDMTTSEPSLAREIFAVAQEKYVYLI